VTFSIVGCDLERGDWGVAVASKFPAVGAVVAALFWARANLHARRTGLDLLGDTLLHVARGLAHLEETRVRLVLNRVHVDARPGLRLGRKDFVNGGLIHDYCRPNPAQPKSKPSSGRVGVWDHRSGML